jgi:GT2 family glycosyltransferase
MMTLEKQGNERPSVIVVNFRSEQYLEGCLASVCNWIGSDEAEIIIVNNDPDKDLKMIQKNFPQVILIDTGKNLGFGKAANLGAQKALGNILFFLNPDAEIGSKNSQEVLNMIKENINWGIVGARLENEHYKVQEWIAGKETSLVELFWNNIGFPRSRRLWECKEKTKVDWISAAAIFIRRDLFLEVGGFDENFFMYFEDMDLSKRIRNIGKEIIYYPDFVVSHKGGRSYGNDRESQKAHYYDSQELYFKKHRSFPAFLMIKALRRLFIRQ